MSLRSKFVGAIYATHNQSPQIRSALDRILAELETKTAGVGLNIGSGPTALHPRVLNVDLAREPSVDCIAKAEQLPFPAGSVSVIITQETLEHVQRPFQAVQEMYRVLESGGVLYCQVPFIIGYHPGPTDYWRFSKEGIQELVEQAGFHCEEVKIAVGPATGIYRIIVEFTALFMSSFAAALYYPMKGAGAILFFPIKWLDSLLSLRKQADRIAGGYYAIARKNKA